MIILHKTAERMRELIKTMPRPNVKIDENDRCVLWNEGGVVEYVFESRKWNDRARYSEALSLHLDIVELKGKQ